MWLWGSTLGAQEELVLTDIMGMEDFMGDMDFKLAATRSGVLAVQADVKVGGISLDTIRRAVEGATQANHGILDKMEACISQPVSRKQCWPQDKKLEVPPHKRKKLVGPGGLNLKRITSETGVQFYPEEDCVWAMFASNSSAMAEADEMIEALLTEEKVPELEFGCIYTGRVVELQERGVLIQIHEALDPILVHNSQLSNKKVTQISL